MGELDLVVQELLVGDRSPASRHDPEPGGGGVRLDGAVEGAEPGLWPISTGCAARCPGPPGQVDHRHRFEEAGGAGSRGLRRSSGFQLGGGLVIGQVGRSTNEMAISTRSEPMYSSTRWVEQAAAARR